MALSCVMLSSCSGVQSTLDPAGPEATSVATLFYVMVIGGGLIWIGVIWVLFHAVRRSEPYSDKGAGRVILWCGAIVPVVVLAGLLTYAVWLMPDLRPWFRDEPGAFQRIEVSGEQFWWRIRYLDFDGDVVLETANEVVMPVGEPVLFILRTPDVIHSFWIPSLGGKMDMIPGRTNQMVLEATRPGNYRGVCAEFCGLSHALMAFSVKALSGPDFDAWLTSRRSGDAVTKSKEGLILFLRHGCDACHAIDGTKAMGTIGPNLSAFGARRSVGAGVLENTPDNIARFIRQPQVVKPGVHMPSFAMLPEDDVEQIALYLKGLR